MILECAASLGINSGRKVVLCTADRNLALKATAHAIPVCSTLDKSPSAMLAELVSTSQFLYDPSQMMVWIYH